MSLTGSPEGSEPVNIGSGHELYDTMWQQQFGQLLNAEEGLRVGTLLANGADTLSFDDLMNLAKVNAEGKEIYASDYIGLMHLIVGNVNYIRESMGRSVPLSTAHIETVVTLAGLMSDDAEANDGLLYDDGHNGEMTHSAYGSYWRDKIDSTKALGGSLYDADQLRYLMTLANENVLERVIPASSYVDLVWSYIQIFKAGNPNFLLPHSQVKSIALIAGILIEPSASKFD